MTSSFTVPTQQHMANDIKHVQNKHNLSPEQTSQLTLMLEQIDPTLITPWTTTYDTPAFLCQRFLRARDFNIPKATIMLEEDIQWREEYGIKQLRQQKLADFCDVNPQKLKKLLPIVVEGMDSMNRPVIYKSFGASCRISDILQITTQETLIRYHIWQNELALMKCEELSRQKNSNIEQWQIVIDAFGWHLGLANSQSMQFLKAIAKIDSDHYPERLGRLTVVNAPWTLSSVWTVIRLWLDDRQKKKIAIFSWQSSWEPYLKGIATTTDAKDMDASVAVAKGGIPNDQLLVRFGGLNPSDFVVAGSSGGSKKVKDVKKVVQVETKETVKETVVDVEQKVVAKTVVRIEDVEVDHEGMKTLSI
jgi:hypothetical protein